MIQTFILSSLESENFYQQNVFFRVRPYHVTLEQGAQPLELIFRTSVPCGQCVIAKML